MPALELRDIQKTFDGFRALDGACFVAERGEVRALLGENGAGKSTLMNVAAGLYQPDSGRMVIEGVERRLSGPQDAAACKIGMVHQHFKLVKPLSVAENILLACPRPRFREGLRDIEALIKSQAEAIGFTIDPRARVDTLSIAEQQRVEILKTLIGGAELVILDEPTAVLTDAEATRLLTTMRRLAQQGRAVVLVTHKLSEVLTFADHITVMRGGRTVATRVPAETNERELTELVVGAAAPTVPRDAHEPGADFLTIRGLSCARADGYVTVQGLGFTVRKGEIYGIAGVGGNGQTELVETLLGLRKPVEGAIMVDEVGDIADLPPDRRRHLGFAAIPADRHAYALAGSLSIQQNFTIGRLHTGRYGPWGWVDFGAMRRETEQALKSFEVQGVRAMAQKASLLSGGNAQKLVIAREFSATPKIVVAHSPSRGLDIRACAAVRERLVEARGAGAAVLLISDDLDEVMSLSDRLGVINRGRIVAEFSAPMDRQRIGQAMVGHA
jgi:simple sugar transport system ATP-binding protein